MADARELQSIFERTAEAVALKPAVGQGTAAATTRLRDGMTCDIEEGQWQTTADVGPELGGSNGGPGAGFLLRAAPEEDVRRVLDAAHAHSMTRDTLEHACTVERDVRITALAA